jgi:sarcosine oxidase
MSQTFDCIVLGCGGFGSGALYHLARRGVRVLGIEQFGIAHDRGSSHGETRIIRQAYFEHPDYVPLLRRAYELWHELEVESGRQLFHRVGLLTTGPADGEAVPGTVRSSELHGLPLERLTPQEARRRFPTYRVPDELSVVFEPQAGFLEVERCVEAHIQAAVQHGAIVRTEETVQHWSCEGNTVRVRTDKGEYSAARMIVTAGAWAGRMLAELNLPLNVVRKVVFWFPAPLRHHAANAGNCTFFFEVNGGQFYGFPSIDGQTVKLAEHTGGETVADPARVDRDLHPTDLPRVADFVRSYLPELNPQPARHSVCMYTKTPDCHFIVDRHPHHPQIVLGAGFSGHGFKFTSSLGEVLAEFAMESRSTLPVEFLSLGRFGDR